MASVRRVEPPERPGASSLDHVPGGPWEFDDDVTHVFDDMLERSIPQYDTMRGLVFEVGKRFVPPGGTVVDLGCSRGEALAPFVDTFGDECSYVGVEVSPPMLDVCRKRFASRTRGRTVLVARLSTCAPGTPTPTRRSRSRS